MALPPLELFSLKKRPPCCRVASSSFVRKTEGRRYQSGRVVAKNARKICVDEARASIERVSEGPKRLFLQGGHSMIAVLMVVLYLVLILMPCLIAASIDLEAEERNAMAPMEEGDRG